MASSTPTSISILPFQNPFFSFLSPPTLSRSRRKPFTVIAGALKRSRRKRHNPQPEDMSVSVPMPASPHRRDKDEEPYLASRSHGGKGDLLTTNVEREMQSSNRTAPRKSKYIISNVKCFGVDLSPDTIAVAMVYFVQGVLGLSRLAVSFYLKDDLRLDPAEVYVLTKFK